MRLRIMCDEIQYVSLFAHVELSTPQLICLIAKNKHFCLDFDTAVSLQDLHNHVKICNRL